MTYSRQITLFALLTILVPAGSIRADVVYPKGLLLLEQQAMTLSPHNQGDLPPFWISHTSIELSNLDTPFWFRAGVSAGLDGPDGERTLLGLQVEAGWSWGELCNFPTNLLRTSLRVYGALGSDPILSHPRQPRDLQPGRAEFALPVKWVYELLDDEDRIHGLSLLFDIEPSLQVGEPSEPGFNLRIRAGIAYLFPKTLELQLHTSAAFSTREEVNYRVGLQPEVWLHLCQARAPRLRRSLIYDPMSICKVSIGLWGWLEPVTEGLNRLPWGAGLRLAVRFNLFPR